MSDDDQPFAGRGVLPVADRLPDGDPMDGSEYLALVRAESRRLPTTVSAPRMVTVSLPSPSPTEPSHPLIAHFNLAAETLYSDFAIACSTRPDLIPLESWRANYLERFKAMRKAVVGFRAKRKEAVEMGLRPVEEIEKLPGNSDALGWKKLLYPETRKVKAEVEAVSVKTPPEEPAEEGEANTAADSEAVEENEEDLDDDDAEEEETFHGVNPNGHISPVPSTLSEPSPAAPKATTRHLSLPSRLNPTQIESLLRFHIPWLRNPSLDPESISSQTRWISSLLLNLDPDLVTGEQTSVLRELSRGARALRKRLGDEPSVSGTSTAVAGLNMVIVAVAGIFGQVDLADPSRSIVENGGVVPSEDEVEARPIPTVQHRAYEDEEREPERKKRRKSQPLFERHWDEPEPVAGTVEAKLETRGVRSYEDISYD